MYPRTTPSTHPATARTPRLPHVHPAHLQYPERLGLAVCYCAPFLFNQSFKLIKPFIDPVTAAKLVCAGVGWVFGWNGRLEGGSLAEPVRTVSASSSDSRGRRGGGKVPTGKTQPQCS